MWNLVSFQVSSLQIELDFNFFKEYFDNLLFKLLGMDLKVLFCSFWDWLIWWIYLDFQINQDSNHLKISRLIIVENYFFLFFILRFMIHFLFFTGVIHSFFCISRNFHCRVTTLWKGLEWRGACHLRYLYWFVEIGRSRFIVYLRSRGRVFCTFLRGFRTFLGSFGCLLLLVWTFLLSRGFLLQDSLKA